jgi:hypothetical protein
MSVDMFDRFLILFSLGLGFCLTGIINLMIPLRRISDRLILNITLISFIPAIVGICNNISGLLWLPLLAACYLFLRHPLDRILTRLQSGFLSIRSRKQAQWATFILLGCGFIVYASWKFDSEDRTNQESIDRELFLSSLGPTDLEPTSAKVQTDEGKQVVVSHLREMSIEEDLAEADLHLLTKGPYLAKVIQREAADDHCNCHGWIFTNGQYWVGGLEIDSILLDNDYEIVSQPQPGDLVIYRNEGKVVHTAIVRYVTPDLPILVEGKWGRLGVFLHAVDQSSYGNEFQFYRSSRKGHLLKGLDTQEIATVDEAMQ